MAGGPDVLNTALQQLANNKLQMELLWENASPTSDFAAQTISLDLSGYDLVKVQFIYDANKMRIGMLEAVNENGSGNQISFTLPTTNQIYVFTRAFYTYVDRIQFLACTQKEVATNSVTNNGKLIPIRIYGIKCIN